MSKFQLLRSFLFTYFLSGLLFASCAIAQTISSLTPSSVASGSGGFVLSVFGSGFTSDSIVQLQTPNGVQALQTYFVNSGLLMAGVDTFDVEKSGSLQVDVANYSSKSSSNIVKLTVTGSGSSS